MVEAWEHFRDPAYFDMWAVRQTGEREFGKSFHVPSQAEAAALADILTSLEKVKEERDRLREHVHMLRPSKITKTGCRVSIEFAGNNTATKFYHSLIASLTTKEGE